MLNAPTSVRRRVQYWVPVLRISPVSSGGRRHMPESHMRRLVSWLQCRGMPHKNVQPGVCRCFICEGVHISFFGRAIVSRKTASLHYKQYQPAYPEDLAFIPSCDLEVFERERLGIGDDAPLSIPAHIAIAAHQDDTLLVRCRCTQCDSLPELQRRLISAKRCRHHLLVHGSRFKGSSRWIIVPTEEQEPRHESLSWG